MAVRFPVKEDYAGSSPALPVYDDIEIVQHDDGLELILHVCTSWCEEPYDKVYEEYCDLQESLAKQGWELVDPYLEHDCISGRLHPLDKYIHTCRECRQLFWTKSFCAVECNECWERLHHRDRQWDKENNGEVQ